MAFLFEVSIADTVHPWKSALDDLIKQRQNNQLFVDGSVAVMSADISEFAVYGSASKNTIFEIGSITKAFTGILFADQVLAGIIGRDDLVEKYIPELKGTFAGSRKLKDLANHHSGLSRIPKDLPLNENPYLNYTEEKLLASLLNELPPKEGYMATYPKADYSNTGFALLGLVLSRANRIPFSTLLDNRVIVPLKLNDTSFDLNQAQAARFINGYDENKKPAAHWDWDVFAPTGGLRSSILDMRQFAEANLNPPLSSLGSAIILSQKNNWGWDSEILGTPFPFKNGGTGGFRSSLFVDPSRMLAIVVLTNISYESDSLVVPIVKSVNSKGQTCLKFYK